MQQEVQGKSLKLTSKYQNELFLKDRTEMISFKNRNDLLNNNNKDIENKFNKMK